MKNKIYQTFDAAVADVPDGSVFMSPGFGGVGLSRNLLAALNRQGAKNLTGISNNAGTVDAKVDVGTLIAAGQVKKMVCAFTAPTPPSQVTPFVRMYNNDEIEAGLVPQVHPSLEGGHIRQSAVPVGAAQFQPHHGDGRSYHHCRSGK